MRLARPILTMTIMGNIPFPTAHHGETTVMHRQSMPSDRIVKCN